MLLNKELLTHILQMLEDVFPRKVTYFSPRTRYPREGGHSVSEFARYLLDTRLRGNDGFTCVNIEAVGF